MQKAGLDLGAGMGPQAQGWSRKGQDKWHPKTYLQGSSPASSHLKCPSLPVPSHTGGGLPQPLLRGLAFRTLHIVAPTWGWLGILLRDRVPACECVCTPVGVSV